MVAMAVAFFALLSIALLSFSIPATAAAIYSKPMLIDL
jgi:hypothetical protein